MVDTQVKELSDKLVESEKLIEQLKAKNEGLQDERNQWINQKFHLDYTVENQKKRIEDIGKTLKLYETENKAMRELLRLWI